MHLIVWIILCVLGLDSCRFCKWFIFWIIKSVSLDLVCLSIGFIFVLHRSLAQQVAILFCRYFCKFCFCCNWIGFTTRVAFFCLMNKFWRWFWCFWIDFLIIIFWGVGPHKALGTQSAKEVWKKCGRRKIKQVGNGSHFYLYLIIHPSSFYLFSLSFFPSFFVFVPFVMSIGERCGNKQWWQLHNHHYYH